MADARFGSIYEKYWILIREHRWKTTEPENPHNVIELEVPPEYHNRVRKAIKNRKYQEQLRTGKNFGTLEIKSCGNILRIKLLPLKEFTI